MRKIIGIDPGSRSTGYGIIWMKGSQQGCIAHGHIATSQSTLDHRLREIYQALTDIIQTHQPDEAAIEEVFFHKNAQSALKLGQARGCALLSAAMQHIPINEYSPREVKKAVAGYGAADKAQVQHMVRALLSLKKNPQADAADALAIAICHGNTQVLANRIKQTTME